MLSAVFAVSTADNETRPGSDTIRPPAAMTRIDESMSSVSMNPRIRVRRRSEVFQYPFDPPKIPKPWTRARPGCATA